MDLSNLSSFLPSSKPIDEVSLDEVNRELVSEFKSAATSVTSLYGMGANKNTDLGSQKAEFAKAAGSVASLYRLSNNSLTLMQRKGYSECLEDMLSVMCNGEDIEDWVLAKKAEINHMHKQNKIVETVNSTPAKREQDFQIPSDYEFSMSSNITPPGSFKAGFPPLSVNHSAKQVQSFREQKKSDVHQRRKMVAKNSDVSSDSESEKVYEDSKDKVMHMRQKEKSDVKRRKMDSISSKVSRPINERL